MSKQCYGCGIELQTSNKELDGYVNNIENDLCKRCFRMQHHNEYKAHQMDGKGFKKLINTQIKKNNLVVLVIDLFDISSSLNNDVSALIKGNPVIIVGSKRDLLLKSLNDNKLKNYLRRLGKKFDLNIKDVLLSSATKKHGIDELLESIYKHYRNKNIYLLGITNVGKSSLVNALINASEKSEHKITISNYPGTTLDTIEIAIDEKASLCDLPGLVLDSQMIHYVDSSDYDMLLPSKEVKAMIFQLNEMQSIYVGGLALINFVVGPKTSFTCFFNNAIKLHRTKSETALELYDNHIEDDLLVPKAIGINKLSDFKKTSIDLSKYKGNQDIVIMGLGWFRVEADYQIIEVLTHPKVSVTIRESLI